MSKQDQGHDADPPRCGNCVYFRREPHTMFRTVEKVSRSGKTKRTIKVPVRKNPITNPTMERCSYGNFEVKPHHVCDVWHSHKGEKLACE